MARYSIGGMSSQTGCHIETIRYYERIGLLPAPPRTQGGHRSYGPEHLKRLNFICRGRDLGLKLESIRALLALVDSDGAEGCCADVYAVTSRHLEEVRQKIADLKRLERALEGMTAQCREGRMPHCPVVDALFRQEA